MKPSILSVLFAALAVPLLLNGAAPRVLNVADFGAVPDDGICDMEAIHRALQAAVRSGNTEVHFAAGTYNLASPITISGRTGARYLDLVKAENVALIGAVDAQGRPVTRLQRDLELNNDTNPPSQLIIEESSGVTVRNFALINNPPLGSTARVIAVDTATDTVTVKVLPGLPAYDGMRIASAHAWDLEARTLKRFGRTPDTGTLTIGTRVETYWKAVPDTGARQLSVTGAGFAAKVAVGDGISWHHRSGEVQNQTRVMHSRDIVFDNILLPNVSQMGMIAAYNRNLTLRRILFEPENGNLAVGGRDGLHLSMNSGELLVEDCVFIGLRMDPLVLRKTFGVVKEIRADGTVITEPGFTVPAGDRLRFWVGEEPQDVAVTRSKRERGRAWSYRLAGPLPPEVKVGTAVTFQTYSLDRGIIRNCVFRENFGSAIVNFEENITVEGCTFANNSYQVKYGPNRVSGAFVRNNVIRNNVFEDTSWIDIARRNQPATLLIHSINNFFEAPRYNRGIQITGNVFRNPHGDSSAVAIDVRHATDVTIADNRFEGFVRNVAVDPATTARIAVQP